MKHLLLALMLLLTGCTTYKYEAIYAGTPYQVTKDADLVIPAAPAELRLRQLESRCVVMIDNPTAEAITLDGGGSAVVDPRHESRGIRTQLIPPGSFTKLVLPPMEDRPPAGPQWHFGLGIETNADATKPPPPAPISAPPPGLRNVVYLATSDDSMEYWEWDGAGEVRVILALKQNDQTTRHELIVRRTKK